MARPSYAMIALKAGVGPATIDPILQLHLTFVDERDPHAIARHIATPALRRAGLIVSAPDHPDVQDTLTRARVVGLPVVQIVTAAIGGADYVGIDNYAAGRTAAMLVSRMGAVAGTIAALCHSHVYGCIASVSAAFRTSWRNIQMAAGPSPSCFSVRTTVS